MSLRHVDPKQRVAVITGCSEPNSLGAAFARELLGRKWTVFATARSLSTLDNLRDIGCHVLALDVTSDESVAQAAQHLATRTGGRLDLLINNAGALASAPIALTDPAKLAAMHDLHILGPLRMTQAFLPYMSGTATPSIRAKIVNIGSVISNGFPWYAAYASTKAGSQVLSDVMRREFRPFNIDVITVELGITQTALYSGTKGFDLVLEGAEPFRNAEAAIVKSARAFAEAARTAPSPLQVSKIIVDSIEQRHSPRKLYLGQNSFLFRWIVPYLPIWASDALFAKLMNLSVAAG